MRPTISEIRDAEREGAWQFNWPGADLLNPDVPPGTGFDRTQPQGRRAKVTGLGFNPNTPLTIADLQIGDSGCAKSEFRRVQVYHLLGDINPGRTATRPYSEAIGLATFSSSDQRPRYLHCSLFATGYPRGTGGTPDPPFPEWAIETFKPGIQAGTSFDTPASYPGVPLIPTVKFRVLVSDESGGRYFDVDVMGARSFNFYAFSVTVFVLLKEGGYQVDPTVDASLQEPLGPGVVENAIVGARIVPIFQNQTQNTDHRTVSLDHPGGNSVGRNIPVPPGATRVQLFNTDGGGVPALYTYEFVSGNPFTATDDSNTSVGAIDFIPGLSRTQIYDIPNANQIRVRSGAGATPATQFSAVFEVDSG